MDLKLTEKSVVITEVASNIGRATALKLAEESAELKAYKTSCNFTFIFTSVLINKTVRVQDEHYAKSFIMNLGKLADHELVECYRNSQVIALDVLIRRQKKLIFLQIYSKVQDRQVADHVL